MNVIEPPRPLKAAPRLTAGSHSTAGSPALPRRSILPPGLFRLWMPGAAGAVLLAAGAAAQEMQRPHDVSVFSVLAAWTPAILKGFWVNIYISVASILLATLLGLFVGLGQLSRSRVLRWASWTFTHFFRNAPWLVLLFYCMLLLPFSVTVGGITVPLSDSTKAILGIAAAAAANMSEVFRGAIQSIPTGQWESASSLAFNRRQIVWMIILPQCLKRMLPPWMNLYALVLVSTPLCSIVGVREVMTSVADMLASDGRPDLLLPAYGYLLMLFFAFSYPIAQLTVRLERKIAIAG